MMFVKVLKTCNIFLKEILFLIILFFGYFLQKVSEKVGGAEGTKLDDDFKEMERVSLHYLGFPLT